MHPTAVYLALRGCTVVKYLVTGSARVIRPPFGLGNKSIYDGDDGYAADVGHLGHSSEYEPAEWADFKCWDQVTPDMIAQVLGEDT